MMLPTDVFLTELLLRPLGDRKWLIKHDFITETKAAGRIVVPGGFISDLNSIPRFLWWASTPSDYPEAGVTHDWLYCSQAGQKLADDTYLELLRASGMGFARAQSRYAALRLFGGPAYRSHA